jgi:hypothetical protein
VKAKYAHPSPQCYSFCTVFLSALCQATQSLCRQKVFQIPFIHKSLKTYNTLNIDGLVTALEVYMVLC